MTSKEKQSTSPTPDKNGTDTGIIPCNFFPARRGKSLRFKNKSANISPATRALSTPKFSGRSIAVTPYEREGRKDLEHPTLCPTSGVKTNKPIKCKKTAGSNADQIYFPIAVHELVTETSNQNPEIIDWVENGEAFVIKVTTVGFLSFATQSLSHRIYSFFVTLSYFAFDRGRNWSVF